MKKVILTCAAFAFFAATLVSCGENKEATTETVATEEQPVTEEPIAPEATVATSDAPTFSSEEVNRGLADYKVLMNEYVTAIEAKDAAKITELNTKAQQIATNAASWGQKLKPEEMQKFSEYWQQLAGEWAAAAQKAAH